MLSLQINLQFSYIGRHTKSVHPGRPVYFLLFDRYGFPVNEFLPISPARRQLFEIKPIECASTIPFRKTFGEEPVLPVGALVWR